MPQKIWHIYETKFSALCKEAFNRYLKEYSGFYMPVTMHKLLVHGQDILEHFLLPIGLYSEEGQESRHQDVKNTDLDILEKHQEFIH